MAACHRPAPASPLVDHRALLLDPANAEWTRPAPPVSLLRFETTKGVFVLELHRAWGPLGADRLYNLARMGYYKRTRAFIGCANATSPSGDYQGIRQ